MTELCQSPEKALQEYYQILEADLNLRSLNKAYVKREFMARIRDSESEFQKNPAERVCIIDKLCRQIDMIVHADLMNYEKILKIFGVKVDREHDLRVPGWFRKVDLGCENVRDLDEIPSLYCEAVCYYYGVHKSAIYNDHFAEEYWQTLYEARDNYRKIPKKKTQQRLRAIEDLVQALSDLVSNECREDFYVYMKSLFVDPTDP